MVLTNLIRPPQGVLNIFLSSTIGDYEDLRRQVQDVLLKKAECACFLSEDWVGGYDATVTKCQQRVKDSGGFIGHDHRFGHRLVGSAHPTDLSR